MLRIVPPQLLALQLAVAAGAQVTVTVKETRRPVTGSPERAGLEAVERSLQIGNAGFRYHQTIDPNESDRPVTQQYGDYILGCAFPSSWNWDLEYFLDVQVARPGEPAFTANRATLQSAIWVVERGRRGVAEMEWPLPPGPDVRESSGRLAVRVVKVAEDANWFYLETRIDGEPEAAITHLRVGSYPYVTTGPPERQRWVTTLAAAHRMSEAATPLDVSGEWAMVLHNRLAQEEGGCLFAFDPQEIVAADAGGTYSVSIGMTAAPSTRSVHLALGYFWDTPYTSAVAQLREDAPELRECLRTLDWSAAVDTARWQRLEGDVAAMLDLAGMRESYGDEWEALADRMRSAVAAAGGEGSAAREAEARFSALLAQAQGLRHRIYAQALEGLVRQAREEVP